MLFEEVSAKELREFINNIVATLIGVEVSAKELRAILKPSPEG